MGQSLRVPFLDLKSQTQRLRRKIIEAIGKTIDSSSFVLGPEIERFEKAFSDYCQCQCAVGVSSGTAALHLSLLALGVGHGDEVITVPNTFIATAEAVLYTGAKLVLVDVEEDTFCMDPSAVARAITRKTKAIIPVHLFGQPCNMEVLGDIAERHGLFVIEDACQAHGATFKGRRVGSMGHAGTFSFYPSKNLGSFGDGGAVTTNDADLARKIRALRHHGQYEKNVYSELGFNYRLDSIQAAVLSVKLPYLDQWNERRRDIADHYKSGLEGTEYQLQAAVPESAPAYHILAVRHPKRELVQETLSEMGIGWGNHISAPIHLQPGYRFLGYDRGSLPISELLASELISLPIYPELTASQVDFVIEALLKLTASVKI